MRALLDVNVLIALLDSAHIHHAVAKRWLQANIDSGWASCPITQNGCLRIMSQPAYPGAQPPAEIARRLRQATHTQWHAFWPDNLSLLEDSTIAWEHVLGSRQLTDMYLLALAVHHGGCLATLDGGISLHAVPGAGSEHLVRILESEQRS